MTIEGNYDAGEIPVRNDSTEPLEGVYSLPVLGSPFSRTRQFFGEMAPRETDSTEVRFAKHILRWSAASVWAAVGVLVVFQPGHSAQ